MTPPGTHGRLKGVTAQPQDAADPGLYGPDSITWRVHSDPSMPAAGLRALLLQAVHPLAMAGVAQNSDFRADPWGRLFRTGEYVATTTFGTTREANRAGAQIRGIHRKLRATDARTGEVFRVDREDLLRWVHVVEVESFLSTALRSGLRLSRSEQDGYYDEQRANGRLIGVGDVPASVDDVKDYYRDVRPELRMTREARQAARFVLFPPMPRLIGLATPARAAWAGLALTGAALMPRWARRMYDLPGIPTTDLGATVVSFGLRTGLMAVPAQLRQGPHLTAAHERLGLR